ncbi:MAG: 4-demethylwyosine synthase TYW1 [archaeon]
MASDSQLTVEAKDELERQQYRIVGNHSAVKTCGWTKSMLRGKGGCYKFIFYGIRSHQCMQMTTSISCANRCVFCWRGYKAPVSKDWDWKVDDPDTIIEGSLKAHQDLIVGFHGYDLAPAKVLEESLEIKHVALSLTGEPIIYPKINEAIRSFHDRGITTFMVTNGQYPDAIRDLEPVTQLYLSVDAPNQELLKKVDVPLFSDYWARLLQSLDALARREDRTAIRLTIIKGINDTDPEGYKTLIERGDPDFIEVKAYMYIGESRERLKEENMPRHEEVKAFSDELVKLLPDHECVAEHAPSRVVLLAKKTFKGKTYIDFDTFFADWKKRKATSSSV